MKTLYEFEEVYGWKRPTIETMVGRLLSLGPIEIDKFTLTKEALELVDKEFAQVKILSFFFHKRLKSFF
jgi:hypothetical protein